jgi:argininosuccinate synthase
VLQTAHQILEAAALGPDLAALTSKLATVYGELITSGRWFSDVREAIDGFVDLLRPRVTGRVRLQLLRGSLTLLDVIVSSAADVPSPRAVA